MKKFLFSIFLFVCSISTVMFSVDISSISAEEQARLKVITNTAIIYSTPSTDSAIILDDKTLKANLGDKFTLLVNDKIDTEFGEFYNIKYNDTLNSVYILANRTCIVSPNVLTNFTPNCTVKEGLTLINFYALVDNNYAISFQDIDTTNLKLKIIDGLDEKSEYTKVLTIIDDDYYTGYVKTANIVPNKKSNLAITLIVIGAVIILILTTILTAYLKRKKKKSL